MDKTRGFQASIDYLMPIVEHPSMSGEYCRHLRNGIDAMMKFEQIQSELERLNAENALLRKVEEVGEIMWSDAICHRCEARECRGCSAHDFKKAMSEYQSWKEGQK